MNYLSFCFAIIAIYALYYAGNVGFDYYMAGRLNNDGEVADVIDISGALDDYKPKDAGRIIREEMGLNQDLVKKIKSQNQNEGEKVIPVNYTGGFTTDDMKNIFEVNAGENFFRGLID